MDYGTDEEGEGVKDKGEGLHHALYLFGFKSAKQASERALMRMA